MQQRSRWLQNITDYILENIFDIVTVAASAYIVIRHQFRPYGPNDISDLATWIIAVLGLIAVSGLWQQHRRLRAIEDISQKTYSLTSKILDIENISFRGITAIQDKYRFDPFFWQSVLEESGSKLDLLGHALSTWCEEPYRDGFARHLKHIANSNGTVRIVVLNPNGHSHQRRQKALGKSYEQRLQTTFIFIKTQIIDKLPPTKQKNIVVKHVSDFEFSYMLIRTERHVVVSPYMARTDSKDNLLVSFDIDSKYANVYMNDFEKIFESAEAVTWPS